MIRMMNLEEFLEDFAYSSPYGIGPLGQLYYEGQWTISPLGMASWGAITYGFQKALLGTTSLRVYAPVVYESLFAAEVGLFPALGVTKAGAASAVSLLGGVALAGVIAYGAGQPHPPEFNLHRFRSR